MEKAAAVTPITSKKPKKRALDEDTPKNNLSKNGDDLFTPTTLTVPHNSPADPTHAPLRRCKSKILDLNCLKKKKLFFL